MNRPISRRAASTVSSGFTRKGRSAPRSWPSRSTPISAASPTASNTSKRSTTTSTAMPACCIGTERRFSTGIWGRGRRVDERQKDRFRSGIVSRPGPLAGIRIVDLTTVVLGPLATQILGDLGAEVIKVEAPEGDIMRYAGPARHREMGHVFLNLNRNKRSLCIDLKRPEAAEVLLGLVGQSDVFMHNMRSQAMTRLGFAYDRLREVNPRLVYC